MQMPPSLAREVVRIELRLPDRSEMKTLVHRVLQSLQLGLDRVVVEARADADHETAQKGGVHVFLELHAGPFMQRRCVLSHYFDRPIAQ